MIEKGEREESIGQERRGEIERETDTECERGNRVNARRRRGRWE